MSLPILKWLPKIVKAAAGILGLDSVKELADAIENDKLTPEQRLALAQAAQEHEAAMRQLGIDEMKTAMGEYMAMIASPDKYVSRARPTGLYIYYAATLFLTVTMALNGVKDPTLYFTVLGPLAGVGGLYVYKRTTEKMNGGNGD